MNFNPLIPELTVADIERTKEFYVGVLHFKVEYERSEDRFAFLSYEEIQIMFEQENGHLDVGALEHPVNTQLPVPFLPYHIHEIMSPLSMPACATCPTCATHTTQGGYLYEYRSEDPTG